MNTERVEIKILGFFLILGVSTTIILGGFYLGVGVSKLTLEILGGLL